MFEGFDWTPVEDLEAGDGCDDAAFLGLETLPGSAFAGHKATKKPRTADVVTTTKKKKKKVDAAPKEKDVQDATKKVVAALKEKDVEYVSEEAIGSAWCPASTWAGQRLHGVLLRGLARCGFERPTPVQEAVLPLAMVRGRDVACASATGSGKTLAFALPALEDALRDVSDESEVFGIQSPLRTLIVAPTRELALQVARHATALLPAGSASQHSSVVACVVGGLSEHKQNRVLQSKPPIVVATPGRLWDLATSAPHVRDGLASGLRYLVVDEADRMLEAGAFPEVARIAETLRASHGKWQTLVFSATLVSETDVCDALRAPNKRRLEVVDTSGESKVVTLPPGLALKMQPVTDAAAKLAALYTLLVAPPDKALVFVNAVHSVKRLCAALEALKLPVVVGLHASMAQRARLRAVEAFARADAPAVLVATDVAARGLDLKSLPLVVHYDVAPSFKTFVHRAGRTARAGARGTSVSLVSPQDNERHKSFGRDNDNLPAFQPLKLDRRALDNAHARAALALDIARAADDQLRSSSSNNWLKAMAKDADTALDDDILQETGDEHAPVASKGLHKKRARLAALIDDPLRSKPKRRFVVVSPDMLASSSGDLAPSGGDAVASSSAPSKKRNKLGKKGNKKKKAR